MKWIPALELKTQDEKDCSIKAGQRIKIYGNETTVLGFYAAFNDSFEDTEGIGRWETIILTEGRGDPMERTMKYIEVNPDDYMPIAEYINSLKSISSANRLVDDMDRLLWQIVSEVTDYLKLIVNYLRGEHNHETDDIQKEEDKRLYEQAESIIKRIAPAMTYTKPAETAALPVPLKENAFMNGGNTDTEKAFYKMGYEDGAAALPVNDNYKIDDNYWKAVVEDERKTSFIAGYNAASLPAPVDAVLCPKCGCNKYKTDAVLPNECVNCLTKFI